MRLFVPVVAWGIFVHATSYCAVASAGLQEGLDELRRSDYAAAAKELRPLAERGDAEAQYRVGLMHEFGKGYPKDMAQALAWLRKSAGQGHTGAQVELGVIYTTGDGVRKDDAQSVSWFTKAAMQGDATGQYNLGMMYAKGAGVKVDNAQAIAWLRKAADQGFVLAQFELGVAYENGEGVAQNPVLAYANYAIAARGGNKDYAKYRDDIGRRLTPSQLHDARSLATDWQPGKPMPMRVVAAGSSAAAAGAPPAPDKCSASGSMEGQSFTATHCATSLYQDQHSVAIWFSDDPIVAAEAEAFQTSSYAEPAKGGKQRTLLQIMFCPGGGAAIASPAAVKAIDFSTNHAKSPLAGVQWSLQAPGDFRVEKLTGEVKAGAPLSGRIVGSRGNTSFTLDFAVTLPAKDASAGMTCSK